jgi:hypothetical protein
LRRAAARKMAFWLRTGYKGFEILTVICDAWYFEIRLTCGIDLGKRGKAVGRRLDSPAHEGSPD